MVIIYHDTRKLNMMENSDTLPSSCISSKLCSMYKLVTMWVEFLMGIGILYEICIILTYSIAQKN